MISFLPSRKIKFKLHGLLGCSTWSGGKLANNDKYDVLTNKGLWWAHYKDTKIRKSLYHNTVFTGKRAHMPVFKKRSSYDLIPPMTSMHAPVYILWVQKNCTIGLHSETYSFLRFQFRLHPEEKSFRNLIRFWIMHQLFLSPLNFNKCSAFYAGSAVTLVSMSWMACRGVDISSMCSLCSELISCSNN